MIAVRKGDIPDAGGGTETQGWSRGPTGLPTGKNHTDPGKDRQSLEGVSMWHTELTGRIVAPALALAVVAVTASVTVPKLDGASKENAYFAPSAASQIGLPTLDAKGKDVLS